MVLCEHHVWETLSRETSLTNSDSHVVDLIELARNGDQAALGELLDGHRDYLRDMAHQQIDRRLARRLDASDVVQQTCLSVHNKIGEFVGRDVAQFVAWLRQIHEHNILNAARDHLLAQNRGVTRETPLADEDATPPKQTTASRFAIRSEERERLSQAIEHLPDD